MRLGVNGRFYGVPTWGVQRFAREVSARLPSAGVDVRLFLPAGVRCSPEGLPGVPVPGRLRGHLWEHAELPWRGRRAGCDVLLHMSGTAPWWGGPGVVAIHDVFPLTHPAWFSSAFVLWYRTVVPTAAARAALVLAPSAWARDRIVDALGIPRERVRVVGQGTAPFDAPASEDEVARVRTRFGLPERYLLAVGGDDPRKNVFFLLRTLERWPGREEPPALVWVGAHRRRVHGRRAGAADTAPGVRVVRPGYVTDRDLHALYTGARAFCFPSLGEGFGRPPLEAMGCGTPVVVADYGPAAEVLGEAARILPLEPEAWLGALAELTEEGDERRRRVEAGLRRSRSWSWAASARSVRDACLEIAGHRHGLGARAAQEGSR